MKCKHIKLIMELIFIFILPLAFLLPNVKINNEYVYDNNGNYETSSKEFIYDNVIDFTKVVEEYGFVLVSTDNFFNYSADEVLYSNNVEDFSILKIYSGGEYIYIYCYYSSSNEQYMRSRSTNILYLSYDDIDSNVDAYLPLSYNDLLNLKNVYGSNISCIVNSLYGYIDLINNVVNNIWGNIKDLILINLDLNDSIVIDIVIDYTCIWFVMFIIWHFLYLLFDFLMHIVDKERRKE